MDHHKLWTWGVLIVFVIVYTMLDLRHERRQIDRYLRVGGARIVKFRWKPLLGWMAGDARSRHYEVTFIEHSGRVLQAIFTYTRGIGVMKTSDRILRHPGEGH